MGPKDAWLARDKAATHLPGSLLTEGSGEVAVGTCGGGSPWSRGKGGQLS